MHLIAHALRDKWPIWLFDDVQRAFERGWTHIVLLEDVDGVAPLVPARLVSLARRIEEAEGAPIDALQHEDGVAVQLSVRYAALCGMNSKVR